jgi:hypothetical protein
MTPYPMQSSPHRSYLRQQWLYRYGSRNGYQFLALERAGIDRRFAQRLPKWRDEERRAFKQRARAEIMRSRDMRMQQIEMREAAWQARITVEELP